MKRLLAGLFTASMFLSACNVQSVDEYEKEKARLESEQVATSSATIEDTSIASKQTTTDTIKEQDKNNNDQITDNRENDDVAQKKIDTEKGVKDTDKVPDTLEKEQSPTNDTPQAPTKKTDSTKEPVVEAEKPLQSTHDQPTTPQPIDKTDSNDKKPAANPPTQPKPDNPAKPAPTTPQKEDKKETVMVSVRVDTLLKQEHFKRLPEALQSTKYVPSNGIILKAGTYNIEDGDSAWTATRKALQKHRIHFEYEGEGESGYGSVYVEGINHIYEKQAGSLSGWMFAVNGKAPGVGASAYDVKDGDKITWHYTTNLGRDIGLADE